MVRNVMRKFNVPMGLHNWAQKYCKDVHNVLANKRLKWRTPTEVSKGYTPDISMFRFHFWEPICYFDPGIKQPLNNLSKGRCLGIAKYSGEGMTYYIRTEKDKGRQQVLVRSVIRTRRRDIGKKTEHINNDPLLSDFWLYEEDRKITIEESGECELETMKITHLDDIQMDIENDENNSPDTEAINDLMENDILISDNIEEDHIVPPQENTS